MDPMPRMPKLTDRSTIRRTSVFASPKRCSSRALRTSSTPYSVRRQPSKDCSRDLPMTGAAVYLIGAGPGDAGLITVRGLECLRSADVVIHDHVIPARVLAYARNGAE